MSFSLCEKKIISQQEIEQSGRIEKGGKEACASGIIIYDYCQGKRTSLLLGVKLLIKFGAYLNYLNDEEKPCPPSFTNSIIIPTLTPPCCVPLF